MISKINIILILMWVSVPLSALVDVQLYHNPDTRFLVFTPVSNDPGNDYLKYFGDSLENVVFFSLGVVLTQILLKNQKGGVKR